MDRNGPRRGPWAALALATALALPASGQQSAASPAGYLGTAVPDDSVFLPPPPADRSAAGKADLAIFRATRAQRGTERWRLATHDDAVNPAKMLEGFGCALEAQLEPAKVPALDRLMQRALVDALTAIGASKDRHNRARPFSRAKGEICVARTPELARSSSYPSGHATVGWLDALILTQLAPDRASQILARGRLFGESRVVCGVHYPSDIEAGQVLASGLYATLAADPGFRADLAAAKEELEQARQEAAKPDPAQCAIEQQASSTRPW